MRKLARLAILLTAFVTTWEAAPIAAAQQPADPPIAPIPAPITAGKKVFISNASGESAVAAGVPDLTYNEFYAAIKNWGRYEIVGTPADADVVFEIRYLLALGAVRVVNGDGGSSGGEQFRLTIIDPKTHIVLWAFTESIAPANRQATGRRNFDAAMASLVNEVKKLASQPPAGAENAKK